MQFVFGQIYIAEDEETAKKIAYDKSQCKTCFTLKGDKYDPSGTLSGGFDGSANILEKVNSYLNSDAERQELRKQ